MQMNSIPRKQYHKRTFNNKFKPYNWKRTYFDYLEINILQPKKFANTEQFFVLLLKYQLNIITKYFQNILAQSF